MPRSRLATTIGSSVLVVVSAKTSAVPSRNIAPSTTAMLTTPVTIVAASDGEHHGPARVHGDDQHAGGRPGRRARPANRPKSSHGSHCSSTASATRNGSWVCGGDSSGPAASGRPSPMLLIQRRGEQPPEVPAHAGRSDGFDDPIHKISTVLPLAPFPSPRRGPGRQVVSRPRATAYAEGERDRARRPGRPAAPRRARVGESLPRVTPGVGVAPMPSPGRSTT